MDQLSYMVDIVSLCYKNSVFLKAQRYFETLYMHKLLTCIHDKSLWAWLSTRLTKLTSTWPKHNFDLKHFMVLFCMQGTARPATKTFLLNYIFLLICIIVLCETESICSLWIFVKGIEATAWKEEILKSLCFYLK